MKENGWTMSGKGGRSSEAFDVLLLHFDDGWEGERRRSEWKEAVHTSFASRNHLQGSISPTFYEQLFHT